MASSASCEATARAPTAAAAAGKVSTRIPEKKTITLDGDEVTLDDYQTLVTRLRQDQQDLRNQRLRLTRELRNARRRTQRIRQKATMLSNEDLLTVLMLRRQASKDRAAREQRKEQPSSKRSRAHETQEIAGEADPTIAGKADVCCMLLTYLCVHHLGLSRVCEFQ